MRMNGRAREANKRVSIMLNNIENKQENIPKYSLWQSPDDEMKSSYGVYYIFHISLKHVILEDHINLFKVFFIIRHLSLI